MLERNSQKSHATPVVVVVGIFGHPLSTESPLTSVYYANDMLMYAGTRGGGSLSADSLAWPQSPPTADIGSYCQPAVSPAGLYDGHLASSPSYCESVIRASL